MNNFYNNDLQLLQQPQHPQQKQRDDLVLLPTDSAHSLDPELLSVAADTPMIGGDSFDDIVRDNSDELTRRRSIPHPFAATTGQSSAGRGMSMMNFHDDEDFKDFHFSDDSPMEGGFSDISISMAMPAHSATFSQQNVMPMSSGMVDGMMAYPGMNTTSMAPNQASMNAFPVASLRTPFGPGRMDPAPADFAMDMNPESIPLSATSTSGPMGLDDGDEDIMNIGAPFGSSGRQHQPQSLSMAPYQSVLSTTSNVPPFQSQMLPTPNAASGIPQPMVGPPAPVLGPAPMPPMKTKSPYSKTGFDMIRALYYVATRPNPEVQLGAVDMSCAFVVCDVTQNDCPIIYVSDNFQNLTGYSRYEIVGRNCRFLQAPNGKVEAGKKREFCADDAVYNLKRKISEGKEVQQGVINYRKGGQPFLNLLTMIPIPWEDKAEIRYFIGFQIDLVECPDAISGQDVGRTAVNYAQNELPPYIWEPPPRLVDPGPENGRTLGMEEVSQLLQQYDPKGAVSDWHKGSWDKMQLENSDDVVHVLSLKGVFLYLSPSCKTVLEYDNADLVGTNLSSICHPSDIIPISRELKDTQGDRHVNIAFRIRRKTSGFTWFESHGSMFADQGKGRKCIILVGRKRPIFALNRRDLEANGGIGDSELWTKLSTSGMFLFVSSNVRNLLELQPADLVGTSIQGLMRKESRAEFGRAVEKARQGKIVTCKHEVQHRRGQVLQAQTVLYPGDGAEEQKPTFLLAQTKLIKASSRSASARAAAAAAATSASVVASASSAASAKESSPIGGPGGVAAAGGRITEGSGPSTGAPGVVSASAGVLTVGGGAVLKLEPQEEGLPADDNLFDELKTTRATSWQYELHQMEKSNRLLAEELHQLISSRKKRKRRKGTNAVRDCANCHTRSTPEWRRGPSGQRDLCNSCGLRWAKQTGRVSPRTSSRGGNGDAASKKSNSPIHSSPMHRDLTEGANASAPGASAATPAATPEDRATADSPGGPSLTKVNSLPSSQSEAEPQISAHSMPPPSRPLLEGGAAGVGMTSIREERETSA